MDSITAWADGIFEPVSGKAGKEQMSTIYLSEAYGAGIEGLLEAFMTPLGSTLTQGLLGIGISAAAVTLDMPERLRTELMEIGSHEVFRIVELLPKKAGEVQDNIADFVEGLKGGDLDRVKMAMLKDFDTLLKEWGLKSPIKVADNIGSDVEGAGYELEEVPIVAEGVSEEPSEMEEEEDIIAA